MKNTIAKTPQEIIIKITKGNKEEAKKLWYQAQDTRMGALLGKPCMNPVIIAEYIEKHNPEFKITEEMIKILTPLDLQNEKE